MSKRKAGSDNKRQFNEVWENEFLFIASPSGKPMCIVCESTLSDYRRYDLSRHYKKHQAEIEEKQKLVPGSELRKDYVVKKKETITKRQSLFVKKSCDSSAMLKVSYEIALDWLKNISLSLTVKKLLSPVSKTLHNMLVKKV